MLKKLKFMILFIITIIISKLLSGIIRRNNNYITFLSIKQQGKDVFLHNTKYLFLYLSKFSNYKVNWICDDEQMQKRFKDKGYENVYSYKTLEGKFNILRSKYIFYDYSAWDFPRYLLESAVKITLWHGVPLKKITFDDQNNIYNRLNRFQRFFYINMLLKDNYYIANSDYDSNCYKTAFKIDTNKIRVLGSPRNDILIHDIPDSDMFMERAYQNIKNLKEQGKKIFMYMPTFRETEKDISGWLNSKELQEFLKGNNAVILCKLHPADVNSLNFNFVKELYKMESSSDVYSILKYTDALITDYSSINFDYLLLDKPIIYYVPDLEEYQEKCRGFYTPYKEFTVGSIAKTEKELISSMLNVIKEVDNFKTERKNLCNKMFKYQDGKNCERVFNWLKNIEKE